MALPNSSFDQISAITQKYYVKKMYDNIFDSNPLLQRMKKKSYEKVDGGTSIVVPLNYALPSASAWYSGYDTLNTTDNDVVSAAEYSWKQLYTNITVSRQDELKNEGMARVLDFVKNKTKICQKNMEDALGIGLFSNATDAKSIVGLRQIVATSNTIGGISQTSNSWWQGQLDSSTATTSMQALQVKWNLATIGNDTPTVGVCTRAIFNFYYGLLQPQQRFQDSETAKGGFQSLMFNGIPVVADSHCPSGYLFLLNENYLHLWVHKSEDMRFEPFAKPVNQNVKVAKIYWMGAFGTSNARLQAGFSALTA